nr:hypothetical protein [Tanacetum cinerariifolium]
MANLTFADSYNMVAYLEKSAENADFAEIVDFLNANPIRYALTERGDRVERATTTVASLNAEHDSGTINRTQSMAIPNEPIPHRTGSGGSPSGEDNMQLMELMALCTKLSDRVLALENTKTAQDLEITYLKKRVKRLEKKRKSKTPQLNRRLFKVRIESSVEKSLGDQEDASKQERNDQDEGISFVQEDA